MAYIKKPQFLTFAMGLRWGTLNFVVFSIFALCVCAEVFPRLGGGAYGFVTAVNGVALTVFAIGGSILARQIWLKLDTFSKNALLISLAAHLLFMTYNRPGFLSYDILGVEARVQAHQLWMWTGSHAYDYLVAFFMWLRSDLSVLSYAEVFVFHFALLLAIDLCPNRMSPWYKWGLAALILNFTLNPLCLEHIYFLNRDNFFALFNLVTWLLFVRWLISPLPKTALLHWFGFFCALYFMSKIRQDGLASLLLLPILILLLFKDRRIRVATVTAFAATLCLKIVGLVVLNGYSPSQEYMLTSIAHPLQAMVYFHKSELTLEEKNKIDSVVEIECMSKTFDEFGIVPFQSCLRRQISQEASRSLFVLVAKLIARFPQTFIETRFKIFAANLGLIGQTNYSRNILETKEPASFAQFQTLNPLIRFFAASHLPAIALLFMLLVAMKFQISKEFLLAIIMNNSRLLIIFFFAPWAFYKYLYSVTLFNWFIIFIWLASNKKVSRVAQAGNGQVVLA